MVIIQSLENPQVKHVVHLQKASARKEFREFVAQGQTVIETLIDAGMVLKKIFCTQDFWQKEQELIWLKEPILVSELAMQKMCTLSSPVAVLAIFQIPESKAALNARSVILYNIQDPGNAGTLIRTAVAMNMESVFMVGGVDPFHPKVVQATAGTIGYVSVVQCHWHEIFQPSLPLCALVVSGGKSVDQVDIKNLIFVLGSEGQGLPESVIAQCKYSLTLAMPGRAESLNVAIAGAIALYLKSIH